MDGCRIGANSPRKGERWLYRLRPISNQGPIYDLYCTGSDSYGSPQAQSVCNDQTQLSLDPRLQFAAGGRFVHYLDDLNR